MKILMIAPEPFFEPRGTPFSEYFRLKALGDLGHQVDLVTYPFGQDRDIRGLRIFRSVRPPFVRSVKTGPSAAKIGLDAFLFFKALGRLLRTRYDLIHTHEEANIMGAFFSRVTGIPHLYDMHSSLVQQMTNFQFTRSKLLIAFFRWIERVSLRNAKSVIVICKALYDYAATITESEKLTVIENFIDDTDDRLDPEKLALIKEEIGSADKKTILYAGTLEPYQGIPLLLEATGQLDENFRLVLIGGKPQQVEELRAKIADQGFSHRVMLLGQKPPADIPYYIRASHVLVSPRVLGTNIPLKIYSFLKSGIPVVATNLYTHTQSVTPEIAILVEPTAQGLAQGIETAVSDAGRLTAQRAVAFCQLHYTYERYLDLVNSALHKTRPQT